MMQNKSGNLAFSDRVMRRIGLARDGGQAMTVSGTTNKIAFLLALLVGSAALSWLVIPLETMAPLLLPVVIATLVLALLTAFKPNLAHITAPIYAVIEGVLLGVISSVFNDAYPGIVIQAVGLTFAVFAAMLIAYRTKVIRVTQRFRTVITVATMAIMLYYVVALVARLFGADVPLIYDTGTAGIVFSLIVVGIAALNLALDFDFIEQAAQQGLDKRMEWYGAFGLMVTLVWLYIEILRLLGKSRD
jgi:uncharacterized YccA/Bax inhibitor family protein